MFTAACPLRLALAKRWARDRLTRVSVTTGDKKDFSPGTAVDAQDLFLSSDERSLFFKNNQDRALFNLDVSR